MAATGGATRRIDAWKQWEGRVVIGGFQLRQYLGASDHSAVFLTGRGEREPQKAAIKLISADPSDAELQLSRWRLAAKLSHPHLIRLFQMGRCQLGKIGLLYVVMEYAEENLSQVLPHRPLTPAETRDMLEAALDALGYLHGKGFAHGRVKPANIMAVNDQLKLSSDGLCPMGEPSGVLGNAGIYEPPESASGRISSAGDIWSLGMTLAEALTQRLPVWARKEQEEPVLPEALPAPLFEVIHHCLRRDPQNRWTAADIAARLHQTVPTPQAHATSKSQEAFAKRRFIVPTVAVGLALATILGGVRLLHRRPETPRGAPIALEGQRPEPKPEQKPEKPGAGQPTHKQLGSSGTPPSPTLPRSEGRTETTTGGLDQGEVVHQVLPAVPQSARDTIRGRVRVSVRVQVDPSGGVVGAEFDSPGPSKYFARLAMQAAQRWKFSPAQVDGQDATREWILRFEFGRTATKAYPLKVGP